MGENELTELLSMYMELTEKQDELISQLTGVVKKQADSIRQMQAVSGFFDTGAAEAEQQAEKAEAKYTSLKSKGI